MNIDIKVLEVSVENKGKYNMATVSYKDLGQLRVAEKKLVSFKAKEVYEVIKSAKPGDEFTVTMAKGEQYWEWTAIAPRGQAVETPAVSSGTNGKANPTPKSTYETPEERAKKQVYIVRQSSISAAIDTLKTDKKNPSKEEVVELAQYYEAYVLGKDTVPAVNTEKLPDLGEDDIPY